MPGTNRRNQDHQLRAGDQLTCSVGTVTVIEYIAQGGQGEVYKVSLNGREYALKYYFKECNTEQLRHNLNYIIKNPLESESFIWPQYFAEKGDRFGYLMELLPKNFKKISSWIGGRVDTTLVILAKACLNLCDAFHDLHAAGYSYKDISNSNVSFDPQTGEVRIVDNDNVTPNLASSGVLGTNGFMAPELVAGLTRTPSRLTDLHSLAVLLFEMLMVEHPLNGKKEYHLQMDKHDEYAVLMKLYSPNEACFIFKDPDNLDRYIEVSEQAHVNARDLWKMYPEFIRNMFRKALVNGIKDPHLRPLANNWTDAFIKLLGRFYACPYCGRSYLYDRDVFYRTGGTPSCGKCGANFKVPRMKAGENIVLMLDKTLLYNCYFQRNAIEKLKPAFEVEFRNGKLRLKNVSDYEVEFHSAKLRKGEYTDYISTSDSITVNGKECKIAI